MTYSCTQYYGAAFIFFCLDFDMRRDIVKLVIKYTAGAGGRNDLFVSNLTCKSGKKVPIVCFFFKSFISQLLKYCVLIHKSYLVNGLFIYLFIFFAIKQICNQIFKFLKFEIFPYAARHLYVLLYKPYS